MNYLIKKHLFIPITMLFILASCKNINTSPSAQTVQKIRTYNAKNIVDSFAINSLQLLNEIENKEIIIKGVIDDIGENSYKENYVSFVGTDDIKSVRCYFTDTTLIKKTQLFALRKGESIAIKGIYGGKMVLGFYLKSCSIQTK